MSVCVCVILLQEHDDDEDVWVVRSGNQDAAGLF
eukprot:COSAG06_NODE_70094_length_194_cov_15.536842_1_plen_33_part_01